MNHAAPRPRESALNSPDVVRHDGRNRRSAETRRKIIEGWYDERRRPLVAQWSAPFD
jgi:hypothetical protein